MAVNVSAILSMQVYFKKYFDLFGGHWYRWSLICLLLSRDFLIITRKIAFFDLMRSENRLVSLLSNK